MSGAGNIFLAFDQGGRECPTFQEPVSAPQRAGAESGEPLSAIATLYREWGTCRHAALGKGIFTTYPDWAEIVGGVMAVNDLGNPTLPFKSDRGKRVRGPEDGGHGGAIRGLPSTFTERIGSRKPTLIATVHEAQQDTDQHSGVEALEFFGVFKGQ